MTMIGFGSGDLRLLGHLAWMGLRDRYLATSLGGAWAIINPLMMFALYTFVFAFVLKVRLPEGGGTLQYVTWLIIGYGPWLATVESVNAAAGSVVGSAGIVKNVAFKTELLPFAGVLVGAMPLAVSLVFVAILMAAAGVAPTWHAALIPMVVSLHLFALMAIGLWLAAVVVFFRDVLYVIPNVMTAVLFSTPIFYSVDSMPHLARVASQFNPVFILCDAYRCCLLRGEVPNARGLMYVFMLASILFAAGLAAFRRCKGHFVGAI